MPQTICLIGPMATDKYMVMIIVFMILTKIIDVINVFGMVLNQNI